MMKMPTIDWVVLRCGNCKVRFASYIAKILVSDVVSKLNVRDLDPLSACALRPSVNDIDSGVGVVIARVGRRCIEIRRVREMVGARRFWKPAVDEFKGLHFRGIEQELSDLKQYLRRTLGGEEARQIRLGIAASFRRLGFQPAKVRLRQRKGRLPPEVEAPNDRINRAQIGASQGCKLLIIDPDLEIVAELDEQLDVVGRDRQFRGFGQRDSLA